MGLLSSKYKKYYRDILRVGLLCFLSFGCSDYMSTLNTDQKALTDDDQKADFVIAGSMLPNMQNSILKINPEWQYQIQQNLNADIYSGYMMSPTPFAGNVNNLSYFMMDGWNSFAASVPLNDIMNSWVRAKQVSEKKYPDFYSIALILKVIGMHRLTDIFGPLPYTRYGQGTNIDFDSQEAIYNAFFTELNQAIETLTKYEKQNADFDARFARFDKSGFGGDYKKWIKLANTLRLRLAIRIAKVSPVKAKQEAEAAANHEFGVLESNDGSFRIIHSFNHPLATISGIWNDILMGAPLESIMGGYNDPRLTKYVLSATEPDVAGQFKGIRQGIEISAKNTYAGFSMLNFKTSDPLKVTDVAESYFLRAEGILRNWNVGNRTAKQFYEEGIKASFQQYGLSLQNYLENTALPKPYTDPKNFKNNVDAGNPNLCTITVKWNEEASFEEKMERIITQKWIAVFPEGQEAWSEFRRTGYPKLFPIVVNNSQGVIPDGEFIKRLSYPSNITSTSPSVYQKAVSQFLGGVDNANTKLWWDVD